MSTKKKKETASKKQKNFKTKEFKEFENLEESVSDEISVKSVGPKESEETEEDLIEKERSHARNME